MPGIVTPLNDVLTKLATIQVTNKDGNTVSLYSRVWNNQVRYEADGTLYVFPKPAAFVEIISPATFEILSQGFRSCDIGFRIHLAHEDYNTEGSFEQDLAIFALRDQIVAALTGYRPTNCGPLVIMSEQPDYEHANVYHYILDAACNFIDTVGSRLDDGHPNKFIYTTPPTDLEVDKSIQEDTGGQQTLRSIIIPTQQLK